MIVEPVDTPAPLALVIVLGALAAGSNLLGGWLALLQPRVSDRHLVWGLAFSGGFLLAVALLLVLPEAVAATPSAPLLVVAGYFLVYAAEHLFAGHAHHVLYEPHGGHPLIGTFSCEEQHAPIRPPAVAAAAAGLLVHSFFDGAAIAAALGAGQLVGWLTFLAVVLHKVPEGFSLASIALYSAGSRRTAWWLAAALGLVSLAGTTIAAAATRAAGGLAGPVLAVACGMFLHISATDLLPTTSHVRGLGVLLLALGGVLAVVAVAAAFHLAGH
jgi:zinc and cadmium transporter